MSPQTGTYDKEGYRRLLLHETVHMVEENVSPRGAIEGRPLWWAEGLAVYISRMYEEPELQRRLAAALADPPLPEPQEIKGALAYVLGWTLVRHIEEQCGRGRLLDIMLHASGPDVLVHAGLASPADTAMWKACVPRMLSEVAPGPGRVR